MENNYAENLVNDMSFELETLDLEMPEMNLPSFDLTNL